MKHEIYSNSNRPWSEVRGILVPSSGQALLDIVISLLLFSLLNANSIWRYFTTGGLTAYYGPDVGDIINNKAQGLSNFLSRLTAGRFLQIVFWAFIGCIVYIAVWLIINAFTNVRNDIVASEYTHPSSYSNKSYWGSVIGLKALLACLVVIAAVCFLSGAKMVLSLAKSCSVVFANFTQFHSLLVIPLYVLITALILHIFFILIRITRNCWQEVYQGL